MNDFFTARPPDQPLRQTYPVMRSGKKWGLTIHTIMLSDRVVCAPTHYRGRTRPCLKKRTGVCQSCDEGWSPRWVGYIAAWHIQRRLVGILELTAHAAQLLAAEAESRGSLRGFGVTVSRLNDRHNGPLLVQWKPIDHEGRQPPPSFDVSGALMRMWGMNDAQITNRIVPAVENPSSIRDYVNPIGRMPSGLNGQK